MSLTNLTTVVNTKIHLLQNQHLQTGVNCAADHMDKGKKPPGGKFHAQIRGVREEEEQCCEAWWW